jgi:hypothetical protein
MPLLQLTMLFSFERLQVVGTIFRTRHWSDCRRILGFKRFVALDILVDDLFRWPDVDSRINGAGNL